MEKINIVVCLILICFILIILTVEKSKYTMEKFSANNNSEVNNSNNTIGVDNENTSNTQSNDINEEQLMAMCQNMNKGPEGAVKVLRMSLDDLNARVNPAFWNNSNICFYRMNPIASLNDNLSNPTNNDDLYYPLSDILLFKNYDKYLKGGMTEETKDELENNNSLNAPAPSLMEMVEEKVIGDVTLNNVKVDDFNQPGVEGLKLMVKNGKKPLAYSTAPSAVIPGANGQSLYVWEPIPPENYVCLGCVCSVSIRPVVPNINECPIRCVPMTCLDELNISNTDSIKLPEIVSPYNIYQVSDGMFIKGYTQMPNQTGINIKSYVLKDMCENTELDESDVPVTIKLHYTSTDESGTRNPERKLVSAQFNGLKGYFNKEFENFLINKPELQLNDYPNNPGNPTIKPSGRRYIINSISNTDDKVVLYLSLNKRAHAYNQLTGMEIQQVLSSMIGVHKISFKIYGNDYHLSLEKVEIANQYVFDPNKIDWTKTFVDPELIKEGNKVNIIERGGKEYENDPFKFNKDMDGFLKIKNSMNNLEMPSYEDETL